MRKRVVIVGVVLALMFAFAAAASAQERVGVIDLALIIDESKAGKQANALLNQFIAERQQQLTPYETQLEALLEQLENEALSDEERAALEEEFNALAEEYLALVEQFDAEVAAAVETLRQQILSDIGVVLQLVGDSQGFDLIIDASNAYYYRRVVDLTFEVIREYDTLWEQAQRQGGGQ